jgi:hypothetical protein
VSGSKKLFAGSKKLFAVLKSCSRLGLGIKLVLITSGHKNKVYKIKTMPATKKTHMGKKRQLGSQFTPRRARKASHNQLA